MHSFRLSNAKPSTILRLRGTFVASAPGATGFASAVSGMPDSHLMATLGIMCEPLELVEAQVAALGPARADVSGASSTALVLARSGGSPDPTFVAQKVSHKPSGRATFQYY
mgnify:CR=1 FL=1